MKRFQAMFVFNGILDPGDDVSSPGALRIGKGIYVQHLAGIEIPEHHHHRGGADIH